MNLLHQLLGFSHRETTFALIAVNVSVQSSSVPWLAAFLSYGWQLLFHPAFFYFSPFVFDSYCDHGRYMALADAVGVQRGQVLHRNTETLLNSARFISDFQEPCRISPGACPAGYVRSCFIKMSIMSFALFMNKLKSQFWRLMLD